MVHEKSLLINGILFIIFIQQSGITNYLVRFMSCRLIGNKKYINVDVSFECNTSSHNTYIYSLATPFFIIWSLIYPISIASYIKSI